MRYVLCALAAVNLLLFLLMGADKARAKRGARRIPEATLFLLAALGGSPGGLLGMALFRHKTQHRSFRLGFGALLVCQLALALFLYLKTKGWIP